MAIPNLNMDTLLIKEKDELFRICICGLMTPDLSMCV